MILLYICLYVMALICNETRQGIWNACLNISGDLLHMMCLVMVSHYSNITWALCCLKTITLQWRHNEHDGISNYWYLDYLLNRLFRCRSKKTSKLHVTGLCEGNPLVTRGFPSNAENYPIWWCHHEQLDCLLNNLLRLMPKKASKHHQDEGNPLVTAGHSHRASDVENISMSWHHHVFGHNWCWDDCNFLVMFSSNKA